MTTVDVLRVVFAGVVLFVACPLIYVYWDVVLRALGYDEEPRPDSCPDVFPAEWCGPYDRERHVS